MTPRVLTMRASVLLMTALAIALPMQAFAAQKQHHKRETREVIIGLEQQWRQAQLADDVPAMDKLLSDDYLGITASGDVITKAQQLDRMRDKHFVITTLEISDIKVKFIGQIAIVNSQAKVEGTNDDDRPLNGSFRYTRVYQHLPTGVWKITSFEVTRIRGPRTAEASHQQDDNSSARMVSSPAPGH